MRGAQARSVFEGLTDEPERIVAPIYVSMLALDLASMLALEPIVHGSYQRLHTSRFILARGRLLVVVLVALRYDRW